MQQKGPKKSANLFCLGRCKPVSEHLDHVKT